MQLLTQTIIIINLTCYLTVFFMNTKTPFFNPALYYSKTYCLGIDQTLPSSSQLHLIWYFDCHQLLLLAHNKQCKVEKHQD